jgi:hypothetical protein
MQVFGSTVRGRVVVHNGTVGSVNVWRGCCVVVFMGARSQ